MPFSFTLALTSLGENNTLSVETANGRDRTNLANANVLGMGEALSLTANQYNLALSIFFVGYVLFETPSNIIIRRINARVYISAMAVSLHLYRLLTV